MRVGLAASLGLAALAAMSCGLSPASPYEKYVHSLNRTLPAESRIAADWVAAGEEALQQPVSLALPFREVLYFDPRQIRSTAYRMELRRGQKLLSRVDMPQDSTGLCFVDLFAFSGDWNAPDRVAQAAESAHELRYEVPRDGTYLLRIQPELSARGTYTVEVVNEATFAFPVRGRGPSAVASLFGDPRSGGRRHEGIDIFAPRGTPALAVTDSRVLKVADNRLGGRVVWLRGDGLSFYYAHLDQQKVAAGAQLRKGDVVGLVGNTGNAASTAPHLHFGIYDGKAVDPLPFLVAETEPGAVAVDLGVLDDWLRIRNAQVNLRQGPSTATTVVDQLPRSTLLRVYGAYELWYRAELPDGRRGYLYGPLVEAAATPLRQLEVEDSGRQLLYQPRAGAAVVTDLLPGDRLDVLGTFEDFLLVRSPDDLTGWIAKSPPARPASPSTSEPAARRDQPLLAAARFAERSKIVSGWRSKIGSYFAQSMNDNHCEPCFAQKNAVFFMARHLMFAAST